MAWYNILMSIVTILVGVFIIWWVYSGGDMNTIVWFLVGGACIFFGILHLIASA